MTANTRILHYVDSTNTAVFGGVPRFVLDAAQLMADRGHPSTILTPDTEETPSAWLDTGERYDVARAVAGTELTPVVKKIERSKVPGMLSALGMKTVRQELAKADVVHLHCVWSFANMQIAAAARSMGVPYVVSCHGMLDDWCMNQKSIKKKAYLGIGGRAMLEKASRVHCTATAELAQSSKWYPRGAGTVIPLLMDLAPYRELPGLALARNSFSFLREKSQPTVLFLSRLHEKKGVDLLIAAAAMLRDRGVAGDVALAGGGDTEYVQSLKAQAATLGVADRVHFLGMVRGAEKVSLYQNADLFVLPTSQENFGIVLIEALACGTPLITTKGVDIWQDIQQSGAATIVDQSAATLADAIAYQLSSPEGLRAAGSAARPWVFAQYDESVLAPRYERFYADAAQTAAVPTGAEVRESERVLELAGAR